MEDGKVMKHIEDLVAEEDKLYAISDLSDANIKRLHKIKTELDQYWDYLRQRRALRYAGKSPENASVRGEDTIKNYKE